MLSIIITHYQTPVLLKLCLKSIQDNIDNVKYEIIVGDSESKKETQEMIEEKFPEVKLICFPKNVGYAKIVNAGIKASEGDYILILNADILISKNSVSSLLNFIQDHPTAGIVAPKLLGFNSLSQYSAFRFPDWGAFLARRTFLGNLNWGKKKIDRFLIKDKKLSSPEEVDWVQGSAMLTTKEAIEKVGLIDERFFMYLEDADWCRRFWQNGYQVIYLPNSQMYHYYYRISKKWSGLLDIAFNKYTRIHIVSAFKYFWKWRLLTK